MDKRPSVPPPEGTAPEWDKSAFSLAQEELLAAVVPKGLWVWLWRRVRSGNPRDDSTCVTRGVNALMFLCQVQCEVRRPVSVRALLRSLASIEVCQGERGRPRARHMLTEIDATAQRLYDLFNLNAYAPMR